MSGRKRYQIQSRYSKFRWIQSNNKSMTVRFKMEINFNFISNARDSQYHWEFQLEIARSFVYLFVFLASEVHKTPWTMAKNSIRIERKSVWSLFYSMQAKYLSFNKCILLNDFPGPIFSFLKKYISIRTVGYTPKICLSNRIAKTPKSSTLRTMTTRVAATASALNPDDQTIARANEREI